VGAQGVHLPAIARFFPSTIGQYESSAATSSSTAPAAA